jgi:serine/threonine-protein kinase
MVVQNELERIRNLPWLELGYMNFYYSLIGFFASPLADAWAWAVACAWALAVVWTWSTAGAWGLVAALVWTFTLVCAWGIFLSSGVAVFSVGFFIFNFLLFVAYSFASKKLKTSFRKLHYFLILAATSSLGLFLGWLTYQFYPIFANR